MIDVGMIIFAKYLFLVIVFLTVGYFFMQKRTVQKKILFFALISLPLIFIIAKILSMFYYDPRPFVLYHFTPLIPHDATNGFPSDHALLSFGLSFLLFFFHQKIGACLLFLSILVGISRMYVGVHSWVDITASFFIAFVVAFGTHLILKRVYR